MNFRQCALIFERYPTEQSWHEFFNIHRPFWEYITQTAKDLFPINMVYPANVDENSASAEGSLEDFFALYFLLIMYQHNHRTDEGNFSRDQELWKHLWDRECWSHRVSEEALVDSLHRFKIDLNKNLVSVEHRL